MRIRTLVPLVALLAAACTDHRDLTEAANRRAVQATTPVGTLDQNIAGLLALFPKGLANAGTVRWTNVKRKYQDGLTTPSQMRVAKDMLFELADWVQQKAPEMDTPPNGESKAAAAARLTLYMSLYVYGSPTTPPPTFTPAADDAVGLVTPSAPATIVTPTTNAGVSLPTGSVDESTIIVVTENPTPYPDNCSGPLATKVCQYPRFYTFSQFPHKRLQTPAKFAVCHVNGGTNRNPLADHDRFRLAHDKPADTADYTPGSTIRDQNGESIEILPLITQTFSVCTDVEYALAEPRAGISGLLTRLAHAVSKAMTPKSAYAIDQGGGGESLDFSDFNVIDPLSQPDDSVQSPALSTDSAHAGDHLAVTFTVKNVGTAASAAVPATVRWSTSPTISPTSQILATTTIPAAVPGASTAPTTVSFVVPTGATTGSYFIGILVDDDAALPDFNLSNNVGVAPLAINPDIGAQSNMNVGSASVCALNPSNTIYCWGWNLYHQLGVAGADVASPFNPTPLPPFTKLAAGMAQSVCGVKSDNSAVCWGRGGFGQLGGGVAGSPGFNPPVTVVGGISWANITVNRLSTCGVSTTGTGYCWGSNQRGEIGKATVPLIVPGPQANPAPVLVDGGLTFKTIVAGWLHACGITTSGATYCWGDNSRGQLGIGSPDTLPHRSPLAIVGGLQFIQLSLGSTHTCGITIDHLAYCWGENFTGQLGDGTTTRRASPTAVGGGAHYAYIATGAGFTDGTTAPIPPLTPQGGAAHTCALTESGLAHCWGWNGAGELGDGTTTDHLSPALVSGGLTFTSLASGGSQSCGRRGNAIWCWGGNLNGGLGNGTFSNSSVPVLVSSPFNVP